VPVTLNVTAATPSTLTVSPNSLSFTYAIGNPVPIPFVINVGSSTAGLNYTAAALGGAWLSVAPAGGATPGALFISVNPANLAVGTYNGSITITSTTSPTSVQTVPVTLAVTNGGPSACPAP
jgi:hypothetical protein